MPSIQSNFSDFKRHYTRKSIERDYELLYLFDKHSTAVREASNANYIIHRHNLPLVAIVHGNANYFIVKSNETEL